MIQNLERFLDMRSKISGPIFPLQLSLLDQHCAADWKSAGKRGQSINSERFGFSVLDLYVPLTSRIYNQREMNHAEDRSRGARAADNQRDRNYSKSRKNFNLAAQSLQPGISASLFISFGVLIARRIGGAHDKCVYLSSAHSAEQPRKQPKRQINHAENCSGGKGRATKNLGDFRGSSFSERF